MCLFLIFALTFMLFAQQNVIGEEGEDPVIDTHGTEILSSNHENSPGINTGGDFSGNEVMVPFHTNIVGGLKRNMTFIIQGFIPNIDSSFAIDFMAGSDIALHINPRLSGGTVVRNSLLKGSWGYEELDVPFNPFKYGEPFELSVTCGKYQFIVYANDEFLFSYTHRYIYFHRINILEIKGDVILYRVRY